MGRIDRQLWSRLESKRLANGEYEASRPLPRVDFYTAVSHGGFHNLLLGVASNREWFQDDRSRGLAVRGKELQVEGASLRPFLIVSCTDRNGHEAFDLVAEEILDRLVSGEKPAKAITLTLERWRRFWGNSLNGALSDEAVRGLFGELWFLSVWLLPYSQEPLAHWSGPTGTRYDFQWPDQAVEVKTTLSSRGHIHHINGVDQLETPGFGPLYLFSLRLQSEPGSENSLVSLIHRVQQQLADNAGALTLLEDRLASAGYSPAHDQHYDQQRFRVVDERLYDVKDGFPRITASTFDGGVPSGVEAVSYIVNLETCPQLCVAHSPGGSWPLPAAESPGRTSHEG